MASLARRLRNLRAFPALKRIVKASAGQDLYLTGGYLRDLHLGIPPKAELDLTVGDPKGLVRRWRRSRGVTVFLMDPERDTYRVVLPAASGLEHIDITRLRAGTIEEDLRLRDFTVNALAVKLSPGIDHGALLDATGGLGDLERRRLRTCSSRSLRDDPLRALRAIRLSVNLGLVIEEHTLSRVARSRSGLSGTAAERVRSELFQILQGPSPRDGMRRIVSLGILGFLHPLLRSSPSPPLTRMGRLTGVTGLCSPRGPVVSRLDSRVEDGVSRRGLLFLAAFLLDRKGGGEAGRLSRRLLLGREAASILAGQVDAALPRRWDHRSGSPSREDLLRFHRQSDRWSVEAALHGAAALPSPAAGRERAERFLRRYFRTREIFLRPAILTGRLALAKLPTRPGPPLGRLLAGAKEAQDLGRFRTPGGALRWARAHRERS